MLLRDGGDGPEKALWRDDVARGALDGLDDDRGDLARRLIADHVSDVLRAGDPTVRIAEPERAAVAVGIGREVLAGQEGSQMVLELAAEQAQDPARLAVEAAPEAEDLLFARRRLRQPQSRFHGLRAAREELDACEPLRSEGGEELEEPRPRFRREAAEGQRLDLPLQRLDVVGMAVPDAADGDARDEVDVLVAVLVDERRALAPSHRQAGVQREGLKARRDVPLLPRHDLPRARADLPARRHRSPPSNRRAR